jgi:hypothetical protein
MPQKSFQTLVCHDLNFCLRTCHSVQHLLEFNDSTDLTNRTHVWKRLFCPCLMRFLLSRSLFSVSNHLVCRSAPPGTPVGKPPLPPNPNGSSHLWSRAARSGAPRGAKSELRGRRGLGQRAPRGQGRALGPVLPGERRRRPQAGRAWQPPHIQSCRLPGRIAPQPIPPPHALSQAVVVLLPMDVTLVRGLLSAIQLN